jgi:hypothetical protein
LTERRERKRARRAITRPVTIDTAFRNADASDQEVPLGRLKSPPKKKRQLKGLSLMHGFAADNVGGNRLTVGTLSFLLYEQR